MSASYIVQDRSSAANAPKIAPITLADGLYLHGVSRVQQD